MMQNQADAVLYASHVAAVAAAAAAASSPDHGQDSKGAVSGCLSWTKDGVIGGGPCSMDVLLDWIARDGNLARWFNDRRTRDCSKEVLCREIVAEMQKKSIMHRKPSDIRRKICDLFTSYYRARSWLTTNEDRLRQEYGDMWNEQLIESAVKRHCKHYAVLHAAFQGLPPSLQIDHSDWNNLDDMDDPAKAKKRTHSLILTPSRASKMPRTDNVGESPTSPGMSSSSAIEPHSSRRIIATIDSPGMSSQHHVSATPGSMKSVLGMRIKESDITDGSPYRRESFDDIGKLSSKQIELMERQTALEEQKLAMEKDRIATDKLVAKCNMMKMLHEMGFSKDEVLDRVKEL